MRKSYIYTTQQLIGTRVTNNYVVDKGLAWFRRSHPHINIGSNGNMSIGVIPGPIAIFWSRLLFLSVRAGG